VVFSQIKDIIIITLEVFTAREHGGGGGGKEEGGLFKANAMNVVDAGRDRVESGT
jgi:hypothetical protein